MASRKSPSPSQRGAGAARATAQPAASAEAVKVVGELFDFDHDSLGYALRRAQLRTYELYYDMVMGACGLTPAQLTALSHVARRQGLNQAGLAQLLQVSGPSALRIVDALEGAGLVSREALEGDRRSYALVLTALGAAKMLELSQLIRDFEARIASRLSAAERTTLLDLLERVGLS